MTKVLVVEDEQSLREPLVFMLEKEGYDVIEADNGEIAIQKFQAEGADVILLDLMMPKLDGNQVCKQIRLSSNVPIIMLTAKDSEVDKVVGLEIGADDYVTKPYSTRELLARMKAKKQAILEAARDAAAAAADPLIAAIQARAARPPA